MILVPGYSQLQVADIFTDNMVLQREAPIKIWGKAKPDADVKVKLAGKTYTSKVDRDSIWSLEIEALRASTTPMQILVSQGYESIIFQNVLVGDVWLLLGQSNMEWPMASEEHYTAEISKAENDLLRFYNPHYIGKNIYSQAYTTEQNKSLQREEMFSGVWEESDAESFKDMSAVGYYFGKIIAENQQVPIGLINLAIGGAPIETFIDSVTLKQSKFSEKVKGNWLENPHLPVWIRERGAENVGSMNLNHAFRPGFVYKTGIAPITKFPITGILWYQGESNAQETERVQEYDELQNLMVNDYREKWKAPKLPFYFVQLSSIDTLNYKSHYWPEFRNEQLKSLNSLSDVGMAVSLDKGAKNDVHPRNKKVIGARLAAWALNKIYDQAVGVSGPIPEEAVFMDGQVEVSFRYASGGLKTADSKEVRGFSIDGKELPATIKGDKIIIRTDQQAQILYYAWEPFSHANLVNTENLPAPTFKVEIKK